DLAKHNGGSLIEREPGERVVQARGQFLLCEHAVRRRRSAGERVAVGGQVLVQRHLIRSMTPAPESVAVPRLVHCNAVDPGAKGRLATKLMKCPENTKEYFLGEIDGLVAVAEQVH